MKAVNGATDLAGRHYKFDSEQNGSITTKSTTLSKFKH